MTPREYYASELRRLREAVVPRMSQEKLGALVFVSGGYIGQLETAVRVPQLDLSKRIDEALSTGGVLERLHALLDFSRFPDYFKHAKEYESQALTISEFAALIVPGVLQTPEYAHAIFLGAEPTRTDEELAQLVAARLERAHAVTGSTGPELWYILDEAVLRRVVGTRSISAAQLRHLADLMIRRRVIIQVVTYEAGAHALLEGLLCLMTFADAPPLAYSEGPHAGQLLDDSRLVARCHRSYDLVRAAALSPEASLALILSAAEEHENAQARPAVRPVA
ncbi:helix-turn-helix transcriptional regulator [Kitasatospora sp. MAA19]|uniref:helix-turn-helix domain-containing protein n=1 Tax=Kitasatospora sp. MAA19 TaxID=3035090 RepID=UPI002476A687|nr:helix-turn-helix transcriptional regulator [Kitasatospora sp. MAA19]